MDGETTLHGQSGDGVVVRRSGQGWRVAGEETADLTSAMVLADLLAADLGSPAPPPAGAAGPARASEPVSEEDEAARLAVTVAQLTRALAARVRVEQAIGVLAERHRLRPREAFDLLRNVARSSGQKVLDIAETVVDSASNPLLPLPEELARKQLAARKRGRSPRHAPRGAEGDRGERLPPKTRGAEGDRGERLPPKTRGVWGGSSPRGSTECRGAALESRAMVSRGDFRHVAAMLASWRAMRLRCVKMGRAKMAGRSFRFFGWELEEEAGVTDLEAVEICAGAGGQALGLERAGFEHALAVELDAAACATLRANRPAWKVAEGDVADPALWRPRDYRGVALLAGGVPCPPFTVAGRQLGATDERDLFAWAVELCGIVRPRALLLENVRGLSTRRFSAYRQHVLDRLTDLGYVPGWRLLHAADFGVPQLRPRTVLVALRAQDAPWFRWPSPSGRGPATVGQTVGDLMGARGWAGAAAWARQANRIAPTIVGGSKKHGGADLGPTRAKRAWAELGVDGIGIADAAPGPDADPALRPRLTCEMVTRLQGWRDEWGWRFSGRKTARYRQIGNAFPPPVAEAVGLAIRRALEHADSLGASEPWEGAERAGDVAHVHDPVFRVLRSRDDFLDARQIAELVTAAARASAGLAAARTSPGAVLEHLRHLSQDFELEMAEGRDGPAYRLGRFLAFLGQQDHVRHRLFAAGRSTIS